MPFSTFRNFEKGGIILRNKNRHKFLYGPLAMRTALVAAAMLLLSLFIPAVLPAASLTGNSNTYLLSRESAGGDKLMPIYEYLDFNVQNLGKESISFHFGGWLGYDLQDDSFGNNKNKGSDLQYGYLSYRTKEHNAVVNLGRVMVFEGVAAERVDGIYARTDLMKGFAISAFGGAPVETNDSSLGNSTIYGGRISHQYEGLYTIGLSYLNETKDNNETQNPQSTDNTWRREGGIDLWVRPMNKVELTGRSSYNFQTTGWMEHSYYLMFGPFDKLRVNAEATWINYADYFASTTSSAFKLTPGGPLDPNEKVSILGPEVFYAINENWGISADYKSYSYDIAGSASYYGFKATYRTPKSYNAGLSIHKMDGENDRLKYDEYRVYASKKIEKIDVAIDLLDVKYKEPINDVTNAYSATIAAGYELRHNLKLGVDVEYSKNPDFDKDVRVFAKLVYGFDLGSGSHGSQDKPKEVK
jgi:hypothetical protein